MAKCDPHIRFNPRNRNEPTHEAPKSTARWFDDRKQDQPAPMGFQWPQTKEPTP